MPYTKPEEFEPVAPCPEPRQEWVRVNGVRLHCLAAGNPSDPLVVLLHGFPEFSYSWRHQIPALAAAGFHVLAPDMRGYNLSDKPNRVCDYRLEELVEDVAALIDQRGGGKAAAVVGHDWGGIVAWHLSMWRPQRLAKLIILNAPHPAAYRRELWRGRQLLRSWYAFAFQLPWLPEAMIRLNDFAMARQLFRDGPARRSPDIEGDVDIYVRALAQPGALRAAINYYRAAARGRSGLLVKKIETVPVPTMIVWGDQDRYLERSLTEGLERWVPDLRVEHLPAASHWVHHDEPRRVNQLLVRFLVE